MRLFFRTLQLVFLIAAFLVEAAVLYFVSNPMVRAVVGVLLIFPIVWIVIRTNTVETISDIPDANKKRRFKGLRAQVVQLLDEIRRLNWLAVDAERGFRNRDAAMHEMDRIENRLKDIISEIRRTAGQSAAEPEPGVEGLGAETEEGADESATPTVAGILPAEGEATIPPAEEKSNP